MTCPPRWWDSVLKRTTRMAARTQRETHAPPMERCPSSPSFPRRPKWRAPSPSWTFRLSPKACRSSLITRYWSKLCLRGLSQQEPDPHSGEARTPIFPPVTQTDRFFSRVRALSHNLTLTIFVAAPAGCRCDELGPLSGSDLPRQHDKDTQSG